MCILVDIYIKQLLLKQPIYSFIEENVHYYMKTK